MSAQMAGASVSSEPTPSSKSKKGCLWWSLVLIGICALGIPVLGVCSAIAIPSFIAYTRRAKTAEAKTHLLTLRNAAIAYCQAHNTLPPISGPVPGQPSKEKQSGDFSSDKGFSTIGFKIAEPVYFAYQIEQQANGVRLVARGDLDGDATLSTYAYTCSAPCTCTTALEEQNPLE